MSWNGMTFGQFNDMLAAREESIPAYPVDLGCVHPFDVTGMQWHAHRSPGHLMVTVDYVCPGCGKLVAKSKRDVRLNK